MVDAARAAETNSRTASSSLAAIVGEGREVGSVGELGE